MSHRGVIGLSWLTDALHDVAFAARLLRRNLLFTATATLSLAIGIGANTAVFMIIDALLLRPPAGVLEPDRLVEIGSSVRGFGLNPVSYPVYLDVRRGTTTLDGVYASPMGTQALRLGDDDSGAGRVFGRYVTTNYFDTLHATPAVGRVFDGTDSDRPEASPIVVLSHRLWTQRFNRDAAIVGSAIRLNGRVFTVVGVAAPGFQGTGIRRTDLWIPLGMLPEAREAFASRDSGWLLIGGRLRDGVTPSAAAAQVSSIDPGVGRQPVDPAERRQLRLVPLSPVQGGDALPAILRLLLGLAGTVLAIACANVTGVLIARAAGRQREIAVRVAIGGERGRLIRQFLAETLLLFACGGLAGVLLAHNLTLFLVSLLPALPFSLDISLAVDARAVLYTTGLVLFVALVSGLAPALYATKPNIVSMLGATAAAPMRMRLRRALVVAQVSLSIVLVIVSGLFARSLHEMGSVNPGFDPRGVELVSLDLSSDGRIDAGELLQVREVLARIRQLPDVESATLALTAPGGFEGVGLGGIGRRGSTEMLNDGDLNAVDSAYFTTMRIPLLAGRDFTAVDRQGSRPVVILGEGAVARLWPGKAGRDVIGETVMHYPFGTATTASQAVSMQVVGIVADVKYGSLIDGAADVQVYVPYDQQPLRLILLAVRARPAANVIAATRSILAATAPTFRITSQQSAEEYAALGLVAQRVAAYVGGSLGLFGLMLAALGLYGVTSYAVHHRTREIGIRATLGARHWQVMTMVGREGMQLAALGSVIGLLLAAAVARVLATALIGVGPADAVTFVFAGLLFGATTLLACCLPAYRATRIPPTDALRAE
jgi:predicted permease